MKYKKLVVLLIVFGFIVTNYLIANQMFESTLSIKVVDNKGNIIYRKDKLNLYLLNDTIIEDIKYKNILTNMLLIIKNIEENLSDKNDLIVKTLNDSEGNDWIITVVVKEKDTTVSHFISKQDNYTIEGWINRDNKDLFGMRVFNF